MHLGWGASQGEISEDIQIKRRLPQWSHQLMQNLAFVAKIDDLPKYVVILRWPDLSIRTRPENLPGIPA
jgi:hypothetical protein